MPYKDLERKKQYHKKYSQKHPYDPEKGRESSRRSQDKKRRRIREKEASLPAILCECGCGEKVKICTTDSKKRGMVSGEPNRFIVGHIFKHPLIRQKLDIIHRQTGPLNPKWKKDNDNLQTSRRRVQKIFKSDTCELCGVKRRILRHHADGNPLNNDIQNIVMMCYSCHQLVHSKHRG